MSPPVGKRINQHARHANRLTVLREILADGEIHEITHLAQHFNVAKRTIHRYLVELRELGMRIDSSNGRGSGIRLRMTPVAIQRLIEEITVDKPVGGYNRTYHRHNR